MEDLERGVPMRLTFDPSTDRGMSVWAPDASEILFDTRLNGPAHPGIYRKPSSGAGGEELFTQPDKPDMELWPTDWSRDGAFILCGRGPDVGSRARGEVWVLPSSGDRKARVFIRAPGCAYDGHFSPDGHWVAYTSSESGREEVYVVPFDPARVLSTAPFEIVTMSGKWQVSANGGAFPRWRRDGKELFYITPGDQFTAVQVQIKGNSFSIGAVHPLFTETTKDMGTAAPYDVSPDGQRFLVNGFGGETNTPVTLVTNWMELLKNK